MFQCRNFHSLHVRMIKTNPFNDIDLKNKNKNNSNNNKNNLKPLEIQKPQGLVEMKVNTSLLI